MKVFRNILAIILLIFTAMVVAVIAYLLHKPDFMPIEQVEVQGQYQYVTQSAIVNALTPYVNHGFFHTPVVQAQNALAQLPGVQQATVRRIWPNIIQATLVEMKAIGQWSNTPLESNGQLVTDSGIIFKSINSLAGKNLPVFVGADQDAPMMVTEYDQFAPMLQKVGLIIAMLVYNPGTGWRIQTQNGFWIILGYEDMPQRLAMFVKAYPALVPPKKKLKLQYADMRYRNGFAIKWG